MTNYYLFKSLVLSILEKSFSKRITLLIALSLFSIKLQAQAPINDEPAGAIPLTLGTDFAEFPLIGTNVNATDSSVLDPSIPAPGCGSFNGGDVWYSVVVPDSGYLAVQGGFSASFSYGVMAIYSGTVGNLSLIECDDNDRLIYLLDRSPGDIFFIRFWEFGNNGFSDFQIAAIEFISPTNDEPAGATPLTVGTSFTQFPLTGTNILATDSSVLDPSIPAPGCGGLNGGDVWYSVVVPASGNLDVQGSIANGSMAIYSGTVGNLSLIACDNNNDGFSPPLISLTGQTPGNTLFIRFWVFNNDDFRIFEIAVADLTPPINDEPAGATPLTLGTDFTQFPLIGTTVNATDSRALDSSIPAPGCSFFNGIDVWYSVVVPASGDLAVQGSSTGDFNDGAMAIYSGTVGNLSLIACNDNDGPGSFPLISLTGQTPGDTLFIRFWAISDEIDGDFGIGDFGIAALAILPPVNDEPAGATPLTLGTDFTQFPLIGTNISAKDSSILDPTIPAPGCGNFIGGDVWYSVVVPTSGGLAVQGSSAGDFADGAMAIYSGTVGNLSLIACNNDDGPGSFPLISLTGQTPGDTLFIRFWGVSDEIDGDSGIGDFGIAAMTTSLCSSGTTTTFDGAVWDNGTPDATRTAIIAGNYNAGTFGNLEVCTLEIQTGVTVTVGDNTYLQAQSNILVHGTLEVSNAGSIVQIDDTAVVVNNGSISISKTTPSVAGRNFIALSSPMSDETRNQVYGNARVVFGIIPANFVPFDVDLMEFPEFAGAENFLDDNLDYLDEYTGTRNLPDAGIGLLVFPSSDDDDPAATYNLTYDEGTLNSGMISVPINYNGPETINNYNLLGNPYASAIDVNAFITANDAVNQVYYWEHITNPSGDLPGFGTSNFSMNDISIRNALVGISAVNGGTSPGQFMASGQGFAIKADQLQAMSNTPVTFTNSIRVTGNNDDLRSAETTDTDLIWFNLTTNAYEDAVSQTAVGFIPQATPGFDPGYDSVRLGTFISLFTTLETGEQLGIQGREVFNPEIELTLGFSTTVETEEIYTISIHDFEGVNIANVPVFLIDQMTNEIINLKESDYNFTAQRGIQPERFTMFFQERDALGVDGVSFRESVTLYPNPATHQVTLTYVGEAQLQELTIVDMNGKLIKTVSLENFNNSQSIQTNELAKGMYFIQIQSNRDVITQKLIVK